VNEQRDRDNVEHEQIEDVLSVFLQVRHNAVNTTFDFSFVVVERWIDVETCHSVTKFNFNFSYLHFLIFKCHT